MAYVSGASMIRCYNGMTGESGGVGASCGFTLVSSYPGSTRIDFGFPILDRFYAVSANHTPGGKTVNFNIWDDTTLQVLTWDPVTDVNVLREVMVIEF